jgi:hypothetical protein
MIFPVLAAFTLTAATFSLTGCASAPVHETERGRNIQACEEMASLYLEMYKSMDSGAAGDAETIVHSFLDQQVRIGQQADSPMGVWMVQNAEAARSSWLAGDTADVEAKGEAVNNGEAVQANEGSLQARCSRLGVELP